jgi:hypothetical protein
MGSMGAFSDSEGDLRVTPPGSDSTSSTDTLPPAGGAVETTASDRFLNGADYLALLGDHVGSTMT